MPVDVVNLLEPVQIHEQDGQRATVTLRLFETRAQAIGHQLPVRKIGQYVVMRQMVDAGFGAFALGDVAGDRDDRLVPFHLENLRIDLDGNASPVLGHVPALE